MPTPYIPTRDIDLAAWAENFSGLITASPGTYGLVAGDASSIAAVVNAFTAALTTATEPTTRTPVTVAAKDDAKVAMLQVVRPYAVQISLSPGVLVSDKVALGVNPRTNTPTPVTTPTTYPVVSLIGGTYLQHLLRYRDQGAPAKSRAKPENVTQIQIYAAVSPTVISDPAVLPLKTIATKVPVTITWDSSDLGKTAYYSFRWMTRTGLVGPWSPIMPLVVA